MGVVSAAERAPVAPASAGQLPKGLAGLENRELLGILRSLPRATERRRAACELVGSRRRSPVWSGGQLAQDPGRVPTESDLARHLGVSGSDLREAQLAEMAFQPSSLDAPVAGQRGSASLADLLGEEDPGMEHMLGIQSVAAHWD